MLNGLGHNINYLYINRQNECNVGLFSQYYGISNDNMNSKFPNINNLLLNNAYIKGDWHVGSIFGNINIEVDDNHTCPIIIDNVHVANSKIYGDAYIGGISGAVSDSIIKNTSFSGNIYCNKISGGLVGGLFGNPEIIESSSDTIITAGNGIDDVYSIGGIIGVLNNGLVVNSFSTSDIIVNANNKEEELSIGGFIGLLEGGNVKNSYWTGTITSDSKFGVGSFIGTIDNVSADGSILNNINITSCYSYDKSNNDGELYGDSHGIGIMNAPIGSYYIYLGRLDNSQIKSQESFQGWDFENVWAIDEGQSSPYLRPVAITVPGPSPDPDPGIDPTPDPDPTPTPDPDTGLNPGPDDDESAEGKYPGGGMVLYDELLGKHYLFKDNTKYYIITDEPTRVGGMSVINRTEMNGYEDKINSEIQNINEYYDELMKDATWDLGLTAIRIELSTILSALNPFDLMKGGVGVVGSLVIDAIKADEKVAYSNSYRLQCGYYLLLEQYLVNSNYYLEEAKNIYDNAVLNHRGLSAYEKREISYLFDKSEKCLENAENIRNNKKEIESRFTTYAIGETSKDLFSLGLSSTLDAVPVKTSSDAEEILTNIVKEGSVNTVEKKLESGSINANDVFNLCTTNIPWNSEVGKVKKNFENSFNRTLNI